ncbi:autotransporter outer membrane beta-barrel domain-containing protein, partial [Fusobacterium necrophorum]
ADQKLDILQQGNRVIFTEPINFSNTDIYFRTNMDKEESDRLELLSTLTGTGANLHLNNHAEADMPSGGKEVDLVIAKTPENFKWNLANPVEVGGYFYNASLKKKSNGLGSDIISITVGDSGTRKATLSSTAKGVISNTVSDYIMHHSLQDSIFDSLYSNDYSSERSHSIWAKTSSDTFETKDYGMKNEANTILVGMDRALNAEEGLYGGFFAGNLHNTKKISSSSGKGSFQGFTGGLYLSYRGYLGFGDAFVAYTTGKSKYNVLDTASDTITNDRNSKHLGAGLRFGRQFFMDSGEHFYLEPSAKITYGRLQGESSEASNGLLTKVDAIKSWTTGAYARAGYQNQFAFGKINSYAKIGVTQEILGKYNVRLNQNGVEQIKLDGNTMNYGLGCEYTIGNNTLSLDFDVKHSPVLKNHYKVSVGYQYKF